MAASELPDLQPYVGRWVALVAGRVAGSGRTPQAARQLAARNRPREKPQLGFVKAAPDGSPQFRPRLSLPPILADLQPLLGRPDYPVYLVGGAVRDAILGRPVHDLDFTTPGDAVRLARAVADRLGGAFFLLDAERGTARVILPDMELDFARFRGPVLADDLRDRDFTVNAMALPASSSDPAEIIDPCGGQRDLADNLLRVTNPLALQHDPLRALRAVRQSAELELTLEPETVSLVQEAALLLPSVSTERIRDELCRILAGPRPATSLRQLDHLGLLEVALPELGPTRGVTQPDPPHKLDVLGHSLQVVAALDRLLAILLDDSPIGTAGYLPALELARRRLVPFAPWLRDRLAGATAGSRDRRTLLLLAALLHDIGKPATWSAGEDGRIHFYRHEELGAGLAARRGRVLALSSDEVRLLHALVHHHMRPALLGASSPGATPSRRAVFRFFRDAGDAGPEVCLLCLADGLGKGEPPEMADWQSRVQSVATLLDHYVNRHQETVAPPLLVGGSQLMEHLALPPGPEIGRLLRLIEEAQAAGEVKTNEQALQLARSALSSPPE